MRRSGKSLIGRDKGSRDSRRVMQGGDCSVNSAYSESKSQIYSIWSVCWQIVVACVNVTVDEKDWRI